MNEFLLALSRYVEFEGRSTRSEYWYFILFSFLIFVVGSIISKEVGDLLALALLIPHITVSIRRIRDIGLSGWWGLIFIPTALPMLIVGLIESKEDMISKRAKKTVDKVHQKDFSLLSTIKSKANIVVKSGNTDKLPVQEESIYEQVAEELANNIRKEGLWTKAFSESEGDENKTKALYIKLRVNQLKQEEELEEAQNDSINKETFSRKTYTQMDVFFNPGNYTEEEKKEIEEAHDYKKKSTYQKQSPKDYEKMRFRVIGTTLLVIFVMIIAKSIGMNEITEVKSNNSEPKVYSIEENSNVWIDQRTSLMWQVNISDTGYNWDGAKGYCDNLVYKGYDDWRLPSIDELRTIVDNKVVFSQSMKMDYKWFWSSSRKPESTAILGVNFNTGSDSLSASNNSKDRYVRCVRNK